jgi:phosphotriesterase-related protein
MYQAPDSAVDRRIADESITLENLSWVSRNPWTHRDNLRIDDFDEVVEEVNRYHRVGGDAIVDVSPKGMSYAPEATRAVARETGVTFVQGTAFYTRDAHPARLDDMSVEEITAEFERDIVDGIDGTDVRAGIIGEIGVTDVSDRSEQGIAGNFHDAEVKVLRAGARAALQTGASISVHPPFQRTTEWPTSRRCHEILNIVEEEGLPPDRVVLCHRDQSKWIESDLTYQRELADRGAYVEYDLFGHDEIYHPGQNDAQPSDLDRVRNLERLVESGHGERLLLSHDIFLKYLLSKYGGQGFAHVLRNIVPVLRARGVSAETVEEMLVENPRRVLTFAAPQ